MRMKNMKGKLRMGWESENGNGNAITTCNLTIKPGSYVFASSMPVELKCFIIADVISMR